MDVKLDRKLGTYTISDSAADVALKMRGILYPSRHISHVRDFLKNLIYALAEENVFVFEYLDKHRNEDKKVNIDGFYLTPNVIVIKRYSASYRREIFTLLHELGHYLLNAV